MANDQINQYPITAVTIDDDSFFDIDQWTGAAFESQKVPVTLMTSIFGANIGNSDLQIDDPIRKLLLQGTDPDGVRFSIRNSADTLDFFKVAGGGIITFNEAFSFPLVDGAVGEVLTTNGSGAVSWAAAGGASTNIGNSDLTISATGTRKLIMAGALSSDEFIVQNSADTEPLFTVDGTGKVHSTGAGGTSAYFLSNTAFGIGTGISSGTSNGSHNSYFGYGAGAGATSQGSNVCIGYLAMNTGNAAGNVAIGRQALRVGGGANNVAIGRQAGELMSYAGSNVCVGAYSMLLSVGGANNNTCIGAYAGQDFNHAFADNNVIVGYNGGNGVQRGKQNTIIGAQSGAATAYVFDLDSNIVITDGSGTDAGQGFRKDTNGNIILGSETALATTATDGFVHVPICSGTPTGVPTTIAGKLPIIIDESNGIMYIYDGSTWNGIGQSDTIQFAATDLTTDFTAATFDVVIPVPCGFYVTEVRANVKTAPTGSDAIFDIKMNGVTMLSTLLSIDATELTSTTATTPAVISVPTLIDDNIITVNCTQIGSTIAGNGLTITLNGYRL